MKKLDQNDEQIAPDDAAGYSQVKLDSHVLALAFMFKYDEGKIYDQVVAKELGDWTRRQF